MNDKKAGFAKSPPKWRQIRDQLQRTADHMKELAAKFSPEGGEHLTEEGRNLVAGAYVGHIAAVTNSLKINMISRNRNRSVDDIEEIHKVIEILDCL